VTANEERRSEENRVRGRQNYIYTPRVHKAAFLSPSSQQLPPTLAITIVLITRTSHTEAPFLTKHERKELSKGRTTAPRDIRARDFKKI